MPSMIMDNETMEFDGTIESFILSIGRNPDSYLFLIDGSPVPMDTEPSAEQTVKAIRVASGG